LNEVLTRVACNASPNQNGGDFPKAIIAVKKDATYHLSQHNMVSTTPTMISAFFGKQTWT